MQNKVFEIVKKYSDIKSQANFMSWFLGEYAPTSETQLKYLFKRERELSTEDKIKIAKYSKWSIRSFYDKKEFEKDLRELYKETFNKPEKELSLKQILSHFLYQYLFGTIQPERIFRKYEGVVCNNYIQTGEYEEIFDLAWNESNIMVIYGKGGIGKSQLVKSYIQKRSGQYKEICVLDGCRSIQDGLVGIPFWIEHYREIIEIMDILRSKDAKSLLVIDIPILHANDVSFLENFMLDLELRIIITTHRRIPVEKVYQKRLDSLDNRTLRKIFDVNVDSHTYKISDEQFEKLLDIVDRNTLVIALLGKSIHREEIPVEELVNEQEWIWSKTKVKTVHAHAYGEQEAKTPIYHIKAILGRYGIMREEYSELAIWCKNEMSIKALKMWCGFADKMSNVLRDAYESGLIEFADSDNQVVKMHSLIADAIWKFYDIKYRKYQRNIELFLENAKWGEERKLEYSMLYNGIYNVFQRFNFELWKSSSKRNRESYFNNLYQVIEFSIQSGNFYGAERLIYFLDKLPDFNKYKKFLFIFEISWACGDAQKLQYIEKKFKDLLGNLETLTDLSDKVDFVANCREFLRILLNRYVRQMRASVGNAQKWEELVNYYIKLSETYNEIIEWDPYKNYYIIVLVCVKELELETNDQLDAYYRILDNMGLIELKMKVKLEILYWRMKVSIDHIVDNERRKKDISSFNSLEKEYRNKLWPMDVEILFRQVEILKSILEQDKDKFRNKIRDFSNILKDRVNTGIMTSEMEKIYEAIPDIIKRIK